jgi:hypothetical protein
MVGAAAAMLVMVLVVAARMGVLGVACCRGAAARETWAGAAAPASPHRFALVAGNIGPAQAPWTQQMGRRIRQVCLNNYVNILLCDKIDSPRLLLM